MTLPAQSQSVERDAVSPLELFFDLIFVFAVSQLSRPLLDHLTWRGAACWMPGRWASVAGSSRPALAMAWVSSKQVSSWSRVWGGCHRESALLSGIWQLSQAPFSRVRGPFS
jgi:hypothetical protein